MAEKLLPLPLKVSVAEAIALASAGGLALSVAYNLGYFGTTRWNFLSLLSLQDLSISTLGLAPWLFPVYYVVDGIQRETIGLDATKTDNILSIVILACGLVIAGTLFAFGFERLNSLRIYTLLIGAAAFMWKMARRGARKDLFYGSYFLSFPLAVAFVVGTMAIGADKEKVEINSEYTMVDGSVLQVKTLRITSDYAFYETGSAMNALKLNNVSKIRLMDGGDS